MKDTLVCYSSHYEYNYDYLNNSVTLANYSEIIYSVGQQKDPHKQVSLFSVQFNIFFTKFFEIIPSTICCYCCKFVISTFVVQRTCTCMGD